MKCATHGETGGENVDSKKETAPDVRNREQKRTALKGTTGCVGARGPIGGTELQVIDYINAELGKCSESVVDRDADGNVFCGPIDYWVLVQAKELLNHYKELYTEQLKQAGLRV